MAVEIITTLNNLKVVQTIFGFILGVFGVGYFIFITNAVRVKALRQFRNHHGVPVLESLVPANISEVFTILCINMTKSVMVICTFFMLGQLLTVFDSLIISNTITYNETCKTVNVKTQAQITNEYATQVFYLQFDVESMRSRRNKSGVPHDVLVGQIPIDNRWKFNPRFDVDPYPWRSSCIPYNSGEIQVNLNASIMNTPCSGIKCIETLIKALPEVHEKYVFGNNPEGYNVGPSNYKLVKTFYHANNIRVSNGTLILAMEAFDNNQNSSAIGAKFMDRMWTLGVPQNYLIPLRSVEVVPVSIVIKSYSCEMERVKEGERGGFGLLSDIENHYTSLMDGVGALLANKWIIASVRGETSEPELTPDYWTSFLNAQSIVKLQVEEVDAQITVPCIKIHPIYILLVCIYGILTIIGGIFWYMVQNQIIDIPTRSVDWARLACKEASNNTATIEQSTLSVISNDIRITKINNS